VRGTSADEQATYDVVSHSGVVTGFRLHLVTGDIDIALNASTCLGRSEFVLPDASAIELVSISLQDGGTTEPH
jgi:hypothetical protein